MFSLWTVLRVVGVLFCEDTPVTVKENGPTRKLVMENDNWCCAGAAASIVFSVWSVRSTVTVQTKKKTTKALSSRGRENVSALQYLAGVIPRTVGSHEEKAPTM